MKTLFVIGTRPEAIKLAPVILEFQSRGSDTLIVATGQHEQLVPATLKSFSLQPDISLQTMQHGQSLAQLTATVFEKIDPILADASPDFVVVQGDTTSAFAGAMTGFYRGVPVAHVEAGLRSHNLREPFPEELNRIIVGHAATLHFAPTKMAKDNLLTAGVSPQSIFVTGNTVVDALRLMRSRFQEPNLVSKETKELIEKIGSRRIILVTCHRRESFDGGIEDICSAINKLVKKFADIEIILPVHPNPNVRGPILKTLGNTARINLIETTPYPDLMYIIDNSYFIMSDSGGIQEESPSLQTPILILRNLTERPEVIEAGSGILVGTNIEKILYSADKLLKDKNAHDTMSKAPNPFGDGFSSRRIFDILHRTTIVES